MYRIALLAPCLLLLGCVTAPKDAQEFREKANSGNFYFARESFDVNRPYLAVAHTLRERSRSCLDKTIVTQGRAGMEYTVSHQHYTEHFTASKEKSELDIIMQPSGINLFQNAKEGYYWDVLDISAVSARVTHVNLYYAKMVQKPIVRALKGWVQNTDLRCPDLTANM